MTAPLGLTWEALAGARLIDLAHAWERGMPVSPNHPAFQLAMMRRHGDMVRSDGGSAANEMFLLGGHVGTHLDALGHVSQDGLLFGGVAAAGSQSNNGLTALGIDTVEPILCRGVLLDVAAVHGVDILEAGYEVTVDDLDAAQETAGVGVGKGDAVLIRTGWSAHWSDADLFRGQGSGAPGPGEAAGHWLAERQIRVGGAETIAFELVRPGAGHATLPVHRILMVEAGIHIMEVMNLTDLAAAGANEFLFVAAPLKIVGGTGSPIRPLAVIDA
ncbi:MAG TPA: cyclase family protein [Acidimicrobiia bacterium]|nr:cyclase family protein [Acidimicrobiia bacterium]